MQKKIKRLLLPEGVVLRKIDWLAVLTIAGVHLIAMLACLPWLFNWSSVWVMVIGVFVFGYLGINLCYHRLLTHKGLVCPKWLEHIFAVLAVCCVQDTPARWVGIHRWHHVKSDESDDPHTPLAGLVWGHVGWVFLQKARDNGALSFDHRWLVGIVLFSRSCARTTLGWIVRAGNSIWFQLVNLGRLCTYSCGVACDLVG